MMNLDDVALFFNETTFQDTYGTATFEGQVLAFEDVTRSGSSSKRRILEVGPDVSLPTQLTITEESGQTYIVGSPAEDYFQSSVIRVKHVIIPTSETVDIRSIGEVLADSGGTEDVYVDFVQLKRTTVEDDSDRYVSFEALATSYYSIEGGDILTDGVTFYRSREDSWIDEAGFTRVETVRLDDPLQQLTVESQGGSYDPVTDDYTITSTPNVSCFVEHIQFDFQHVALGYPSLEDGDKAISFLKSQVPTVKAGDKVGDYVVKNISDETTFWTVQGRRV
jgi:hypothetical protein